MANVNTNTRDLTNATPGRTNAIRGRRVEVQGEVVANKMQKTISVLVYRTIKHDKYGKYVKKSSIIKAHDEKQVAQVGDTVIIFETRPLSKTKRWALANVVNTTK